MSETRSRTLAQYEALWADFCNGHTIIAALAERHGIPYDVTAKLLQAFREWRRQEQEDAMDNRDQYAAGLEWDLRAAVDLCGGLDSESSKLTCLKHINALREKLALVQGVPLEGDGRTPHPEIQIIGIPLYALEDAIAPPCCARQMTLLDDDGEYDESGRLIDKEQADNGESGARGEG